MKGKGVKASAVWGADQAHGPGDHEGHDIDIDTDNHNAIANASASGSVDERQFAQVLADASAHENTTVHEAMNPVWHTFVNPDLEARFHAFFARTFHRRLRTTTATWAGICVVLLLRGYAFGFQLLAELVLVHAATGLSVAAAVALFLWHKPRMALVRAWVSREVMVVVLAVVLVVISFVDVGMLTEAEGQCDDGDDACMFQLAFAYGFLAGVMFLGFALFFLNALSRFAHLVLLATALVVAFVVVFVVGFGFSVRPAAAVSIAGVYFGMLWSFRSSDKFLRRQFLRALGTVWLTQQHLAKLDKAKEHKQRVVGYLFHEVRNPINDIVLACALALDAVATLTKALPPPRNNHHHGAHAKGGDGEGGVEGEEGEERARAIVRASAAELDSMVQVMHRSAQAASHVLDDALDLQKLEAGHFAFVKNAFLLVDLYQPTVAALAPRFADKDVRLSVQCCPELSDVVVEGDLKRLRQVLHNFLSNALKFTPSHGRVVVSVTTPSRAPHDSLRGFVLVRVAVSDTGIGLRPEDQAKMFTAWSQIRAAQTQAGGGTGLGLALSKDFVEVGHGGEIGCVSPGDLGTGSTFFFEVRFPVQPQSLRARTEQESVAVLRPVAVSDGAVGVLVVDDSAVTRKLVGKLLRAAGVSFDECENGQEAVEKVRANKYALVLMDKEMPVMDGHEATRQIRAFNTTVAIVGVTGNAMDFQRQEFLMCGVDKVVSKPIGKDGLLRLLESFGVL